MEHQKVAIEKLEDGFGSTILSRDKAKKMQAWLDLEDAMNEGTVVKGFVSSRVKGGLRVSVNGITGGVTFYQGSNITITTSAAGITIDSTASGSGVTMYVETFNGLTGAVTGTSIPRHWFI